MEKTAKKGVRRVLQIIGIIFICLAALGLLYGGVAYVAWQSGQALRQEQMQAQAVAELERQMELAEEDVRAGNYPLALRRLDWILAQQPDYPNAQTLYTQADTALNFHPTATPTITPTATPTITPTPEPIKELSELEQLVENQQWAEALTAITTFQRLNPNYQRQKTNELLFTTYIGYGEELLYGEQIELGLFYFGQASRLGELPQEVRDQQFWAELYLQGVAYYGVNWAVAVAYFSDLCLVAPFFHDACDKLYEAHVAYGDQWAEMQEWCPAAVYYGEALDQNFSRDLATKRTQAAENCLQATPTPTMTATLELPITPSFVETPTLQP